MVSKQKIAAIFLVFLVPTIQAQSADQIMSLMDSGEYEAARKVSLRLINNNDPIALYTLGYLDYKKNTPVGNKSAFRYLLKAAKLGHLPSMSQVGVMYLKGTGTKKDLVEGANWLLKASDMGSVSAIYNLGLHYSGHYGGELKSQLALEQFFKIINRKELEQTENWTLSAFYIGFLTINTTEQSGKEISDIALTEVLKSKLTTPRVVWAKKQVESFIENGLTRVGQGDGSEDDKLCQKFGFQVLSSEYSQCRLKVEIAKREANDRQRTYELVKRRYDQDMSYYEQQRAEIERERQRSKDEALVRFGLALMGGTSPYASENFANAGRQVLGMPPVEPPRPKIENFTITNPAGRMVSCTASGNNINCF